MKYQFKQFIHCCIVALILLIIAGCSQDKRPLVVYSGKGLKNAMDEVKLSFEKKEGIDVSITYAGSNSLLSTLKNTLKGDVFIPGSLVYIKKAGKLTNQPYFVTRHVPGFIAHRNTKLRLKSYDDLLLPGVKIAIGNKDMCAIGKVGESILNDLKPEESFRSNIVVTASTVNELLDLVAEGEVDAALVWKDMMEWEQAKNLKYISIPDNLNKSKQIWVSTLSVSTDPERAKAFVDFLSTEGKKIFLKHGFGDQ